MNGMIKQLGLVAALVALLAAGAGAAAPGGAKTAQPLPAKAAEGPDVAAELVADASQVVPGQPVTVGVRIRMADGWHVYWKNPAGPGLPTTIEWELPPGFKAGEIQWPAPVRFDLDGIVNYGYEHEVVLLVEIQTPANLPVERPVELKAKVSWLACKEACIPGDAEVKLTLPAVATRGTPSPRSEGLAAARSALPGKVEGWEVAAARKASGVTLRIKGPRVADLAGADVYFYPEQPELLKPEAKQTSKLEGDTLTLTIPRAEGEAAVDLSKAGELRGVLTSSVAFDGAGRKAMAVAAPIEAKSSVAGSELEGGIVTFVLFAYVGGLILNLMPCVFPVLSLKILGFVQQAGEDRAIVRKHGLLFGAGVLISFWALAGVLLLLKSLPGGDVGWGFQMQNPPFVLGMILLMFTIGLNLAGVFEIGVGLTGVAGNLESKAAGYTKSFFSGVLATLIATPCTAPFMGAALGWALSQPAASAMLVFTGLGLGMATPYVVLSFLPALLRYLPRPGPWMESFKQFMAFPMFATVAWLAWVYVTITDTDRVMWLLVGLTVFAMGAWWYGRWTAARRRPAVRWAARIGALACAVLAVLLAKEPAESQVKWEPFSEERVAQLRKEGRPVLVDFTASWCITCQANKQSSLRTAAAEQLYLKHNVAVLVADWSRKDAKTLKILQQYGREGVPLYLVFPKDGAADPEVLPNLLTPGIVEDAIERATGKAVAAGK